MGLNESGLRSCWGSSYPIKDRIMSEAEAVVLRRNLRQRAIHRAGKRSKLPWKLSDALGAPKSGRTVLSGQRAPKHESSDRILIYAAPQGFAQSYSSAKLPLRPLTSTRSWCSSSANAASTSFGTVVVPTAR